MKEFDDYISANYDLNDPAIRYKYEHSYRVLDYAKKIMKANNFSDRTYFLGTIAAMYHDLGRFFQWQKYHTFKDLESINHGEASGIIFKENISKLYELTTEEYNALVNAIRYHNAYAIPNLPSLDTSLLQVVRDADKIDTMKHQDIDPTVNQNDYRVKANKKIIDDILAGKIANLSDVNTASDLVFRYLSWVNDINFPVSFTILKEENIIKDTINRINNDNNREYVNIILDYFDELMKRGN